MAIPEIDVDELAALLADGAHLVDVREPDEYESGHIPGAVTVPLGTVADHLEAFSKDQMNYMVCKGGGRSMRACEQLADLGYPVSNVIGGTMAWENSGRATKAEPTP
jgi:rhodanese-related sulfurtransferase